MRIPSLLLIFLTVMALVNLPPGDTAAQETLSIYGFSSAKVGDFPKGWRTWPGQGSGARSVYSVVEEGGRRFIRALDDHDVSVQIFRNFDWQVDRRPVLSWRWRATALPAGAAEDSDNTNDSACGVYVVVGQYQGHAIKYVWSTSLPPGTVVTRRDGKLKIKVLDSGTKGQDKWVGHRVNIPKDYETLFGRPLEKNPSGIAILTDGNAVHKPAGCDYSDFAISER